MGGGERGAAPGDRPRKDYSIGPEKYAASGTEELVVFDPLLCGPQTHGGPYRLQVWQRGSDGTFARSYAGDGPARSAALGAHLVVLENGRALRVADDAAGDNLWLTTAETERAAKEAALADREVERAAKEAALARVAELEAQLARRR